MNLRTLVVAAILALAAAGAHAEKPNILIITVDDMSADSLGAFGCPLPTSPNVDRLASEGLRFEHAHVVVGNCYPSRNVMWSGRYPHNNRAEGFYQVRDIDYPVLCDVMKDGGYHTTIRGKVSHSTPYQPYAWDLVADTMPDGKKAHIKDVKSYGTSTEMGITAAKGNWKAVLRDDQHLRSSQAVLETERSSSDVARVHDRRGSCARLLV